MQKVAGAVSETIVAPRHVIDSCRTYEIVMEAQWSRGPHLLYKRRGANLMRDNPLARLPSCRRPSSRRLQDPFKVVQTPDLIVVLYESLTMFRQIFLDGRAHPEDPQPSWMGYSIGRWEGDVLVVETIGFNDKTWLDGSGHPHSEEMRLTERFRRNDFGHMDIEIVIDDPKAYTKALKYKLPQNLLADTELLEYVCLENLKEIAAGP